MCVHTWFRKCRSWLMMIIVASYALSVLSSQPIEWMSRLFVGSSSSSTSGRENSACASSTRSFRPGGTSRIGRSCFDSSMPASIRIAPARASAV